MIMVCLRCDHFYSGPDEGCPACDKDRTDVSSKRNVLGNKFSEEKEQAAKELIAAMNEEERAKLIAWADSLPEPEKTCHEEKDGVDS
jgi:hypothetical protein